MKNTTLVGTYPSRVIFQPFQQKEPQSGKMRYYWRIKNEWNNRTMGDCGNGYSRKIDRDTALESIILACVTKERDNLIKEKV